MINPFLVEEKRITLDGYGFKAGRKIILRTAIMANLACSLNDFIKKDNLNLVNQLERKQRGLFKGEIKKSLRQNELIFFRIGRCVRKEYERCEPSLLKKF